MFGPDLFGAFLGAAIGLLATGVHLTLQLQSRDRRFEWREPLSFSLAIAAAIAIVVAAGGLLHGEGRSALTVAGLMFVPMFPLIAAGSLVGRAAGWLLQSLRDRI